MNASAITEAPTMSSSRFLQVANAKHLVRINGEGQGRTGPNHSSERPPRLSACPRDQAVEAERDEIIHGSKKEEAREDDRGIDSSRS